MATLAAPVMSMDDILEELCSRFIVNLPDSDLDSEGLFFAVETAQWFYEDIFRENDPTLPYYGFKQFCHILFNHSEFLHEFLPDLESRLARFNSYKKNVPVCGAAILTADLTNVVLVKSYGVKGKWGFPKGKISKDERSIDCAVREVLEETSFNMAPFLPAGWDGEEASDSGGVRSLHVNVSGKGQRIFIVPGVRKEDAKFEIKIKKEIAEVSWHSIAHLHNLPMQTVSMGIAIPKLQAWVKKELKSLKKNTVNNNAVGHHPGASPYHKRASKQGELPEIPPKNRRKADTDSLTFGAEMGELAGKGNDSFFEDYLRNVAREEASIPNDGILRFSEPLDPGAMFAAQDFSEKAGKPASKEKRRAGERRRAKEISEKLHRASSSGGVAVAPPAADVKGAGFGEVSSVVDTAGGARGGGAGEWEAAIRALDGLRAFSFDWAPILEAAGL